MTNRLDILFEQKKKDVLNVYCTAGYPHLNSTLEVLQALQEGGADMIEIGMPYSDPLADGPVIQQSSAVALANGMSIPVLFEQLAAMRSSVTVPVVLMGYLNPVLQYGMERFCEKAASLGIDGIILPDLPMYEFSTQYRELFKKYNLHFIFLVTPETSEERIRVIDELGGGFIYAVSSSSTTGNSKAIEEQESYFAKLKDLRLKNPVLVGFGIRDRQSFTTAARHTQGAIIGSAYIQALGDEDDIRLRTKEFLNSILQHG